MLLRSDFSVQGRLRGREPRRRRRRRKGFMLSRKRRSREQVRHISFLLTLGFELTQVVVRAAQPQTEMGGRQGQSGEAQAVEKIQAVLVADSTCIVGLGPQCHFSCIAFSLTNCFHAGERRHSRPLCPTTHQLSVSEQGSHCFDCILHRSSGKLRILGSPFSEQRA